MILDRRTHILVVFALGKPCKRVIVIAVAVIGYGGFNFHYIRVGLSRDLLGGRFCRTVQRA